MTRLRRALLIALAPGLLALPAQGGEALRRVTVPPGAEVVVAPRGRPAPAPPRQAAAAEGPALPSLAPDRPPVAGPGFGSPPFGSGAFGLGAPFPVLLPLAAAALLAGGSALPGGGGGGGAPAGTR